MNRRTAGFTLLEVLVALTVTSIILGSVYGIVHGVSSAKERLDLESEGYHQARVLFGRMSREIRSAYVVGGKSGTFFRGGLDDKRRFFLELTTLVTSPVLSTPTGISDVRYELRDDPDIAAPMLLMVRMEQPLLPGGEASAMESRLSGGVRTFRMRFYDGDAWVDEWDTVAKLKLPEMIELYFEIEVAGKVLPFLTTVAIPQVEWS